MLDTPGKNDHNLVVNNDLVIPLSNENKRVVRVFFAYLFANARARARLASPADLTAAYPEPLSLSTVESYRSAIVYRHKQEGLKLDVEFDGKLKEVI